MAYSSTLEFRALQTRIVAWANFFEWQDNALTLGASARRSQNFYIFRYHVMERQEKGFTTAMNTAIAVFIYL
jgi:hypothetical protein